MKNAKRAPKTRTYRQTVRAKSAAATAKAIRASFLTRLQGQWFEEITLDAVAEDAGVTTQTIIRRFGGKSGLLDAAIEQIGKEIDVRRSVRPGDIGFAIDAIASDYEEIGDFILHLLVQEERQPALKPILDKGRAGHRKWLESVFSENLKPLTPARKRARLDALVVATDLYVWKLVRRDLGRSVSSFKAIVRTMLEAALQLE